MEHLANLVSVEDEYEKLIIKHTGRYYTHKFIARKAIAQLLDELVSSGFNGTTLKIIDPFAGDGRLIFWFIEDWLERKLPNVKWSLHFWDLMGAVVDESHKLQMELEKIDIDFEIDIIKGDAFSLALQNAGQFDVVFTNPPWEMLKPDTREIKNLSPKNREEYLVSLKNYDQWISKNYPFSRPKFKFAGWGTNLSRVGLEASHLLCRSQGYVLCVLPASFFADEQSHILRKKVISENLPISFDYFPAEARLFGKADVSSSTILYRKGVSNNKAIKVSIYNKLLQIVSCEMLEHNTLKTNHYSLSLTTRNQGLNVLSKISKNYATWAELEARGDIWAGREIDETRIGSRLETEGPGPKFVKGRMIGRYSINPDNSTLIETLIQIPISVKREKILWRDVSRPSQRRRMVATLVGEGNVAGNSLGVVFYRNGNRELLKALLGIMNSFCFEFQLKSYLSTGHISLSALRKTNIPYKEDLIKQLRLINAVSACLEDCTDYNELFVEAVVAKDVYKLELEEFVIILKSFDKITENEIGIMKDIYNALQTN